MLENFLTVIEIQEIDIRKPRNIRDFAAASEIQKIDMPKRPG